MSNNRRNPLTWNVGVGPFRFNSPVAPWLINILFYGMILFCCCAPCVMGLFTE